MGARTVPRDTIDAIEASWKERCAKQIFTPRTQMRKQEEFFTGAGAALVALGYEFPVKWYVMIMRGDKI